MMSMQPRVEFDEIARVALAHASDLVQRWLPGGKFLGREYLIGNLRGDPGDSLSINTSTGMWADFAGTDRGGDLVSLYAAIHGMSQIEAARSVASEIGQPIEPRSAQVIPLDRAHKATQEPREWTAILPVPNDAPAAPPSHPKHGAPVHVARYLDHDGNLLGLIYRHEPAGERKQIVSLTYCRNATGRTEWRWQSLPKPRSLYGAEFLSRPGRILVVEGEMKCEAARRMLGETMIVVSWPGGSQATHHADWSLLAGRDVVIWPDADGPGATAAAQIAIQLRHHGATARMVDLPSDLPKGWDLADAEREGWTGDRVLSVINAKTDADYADPMQGGDDTEPEPAPARNPFTCLGHDRGRYFFVTAGGGQVLELSPRDLGSVGSLLQLAPLLWWETNYPDKSSFNVKAAGNALIQQSYRVGIYDPERVRGRGAWLDEGRTVLHLGDRLVVDNAEADLSSAGGRFIYEQGRRLPVHIADEPLPATAAARLMDLCMACPWEDQDSMGRLLAGWLVIAPVCGAMPWRPHLYLLGEGGSGKSWLLDNIVRPLLGAIAVRAQSKTTEAGLRGELGMDARPVVFDEFETQSEADRSRVQQVLDLARQASSEDGADILKGTQTGGVRRYRIRSCFAFSSINLGMSQAADESRTVQLPLAPSEDKHARQAAFAKLIALHAEIITPEFGPRLLARTLRLLPVIRHNCEVFAAAIARTGVSRRAGDTIGVILAGAWSLRSSHQATAAEADAFVSGDKGQWVRSAVGRSEVDPEWRRALTFLAQQEVRYTSGNGRPQIMTVGELVEELLDPGSTCLEAASVLSRYGIKVTERRLLVATSSDPIAKAFASTPWGSAWATTLARTPGTIKLTTVVRFGAVVSRALSIPSQEFGGGP